MVLRLTCAKYCGGVFCLRVCFHTKFYLFIYVSVNARNSYPLVYRTISGKIIRSCCFRF